MGYFVLVILTSLMLTGAISKVFNFLTFTTGLPPTVLIVAPKVVS